MMHAGYRYFLIFPDGHKEPSCCAWAERSAALAAGIKHLAIMRDEHGSPAVRVAVEYCTWQGR